MKNEESTAAINEPAAGPAGAAGAAGPATDAASAKPVKAEKKPSFTVCMGRGITTRRGVRSDGDAVTAKDLEGGKDTLAALVKSGHVDKN
ncbi:MAG: hypothetical protein GY815_05995 [Gammaproteobacteria bacterium]|nr:hypothetical protein [Gammaproteobacteria bacterium]